MFSGSDVLVGTLGNDGLGGSSGAEMPDPRLVTPPKRQRILDAMIEVTGTAGYENVSVQAVLNRAGVYRQAFYDNFADKDDCYAEAWRDRVERVERRLIAAAAGEQTWAAQLRTGLDSLLAFLDSDAVAARALLVEVHIAGGKALDERAAAMRRFREFLDSARSGTDEAPTPIAGEAIVAGVAAVIHSRLATGAGQFRQLLPEFVYFAVLPYFGAEAAASEMALAVEGL